MAALGKLQNSSPRKPSRSGSMKSTNTFYHATAFLSKLSIVLSVLAVLAIFSLFSSEITSFRQTMPEQPVTKARCVVYDRPPRTGSTTISKALTTCLQSRGYSVANGMGMVRSSAATKMVSSTRDRLAMARTHVAFSEHDLELFDEHCGHMLYITGAAPMKNRLYSALKYEMQAGHGNTTIDKDMVKHAERASPRSRTRENYLEAYPHVTEERFPMDIIPERIVPDYVIRKDDLNEDLQALLNALRCNTTFISRNIHEAGTEEEEVLEKIELQHGDVMFKWLTEVAKDNDLGLKKARYF